MVAPWGFYGMGNIGDEGTLCGFARLLALSNIRIRTGVASYDPVHTSQVEPAFDYFRPAGIDPRRWWAKMRADANAVIGGTPIMDVLGEWPLCDVAPLVRASERRKVPFVFIGCGVENLRLSQSRPIVREELAPRVLHWSVRSDRDRDRLLDFGVAPSAVTTAADLAWLIEPVATDFGRDRLRQWGVDAEPAPIGVNVVNENGCFDRHPEMEAALATALDALVAERNATVLFLCSEVREDSTFDKAAAQRIIKRMVRVDRAVLAPSEYFSPRELMSIIGCCQLTVTMRYHFCLFSALQAVPFIAIERADKVADLCWDLNWRARVKPPGFTAAELHAHADWLAEKANGSEAQLKQRVSAMKERSLRNVIALEALGSTMQSPAGASSRR